MALKKYTVTNYQLYSYTTEVKAKDEADALNKVQDKLSGLSIEDYEYESRDIDFEYVIETK